MSQGIGAARFNYYFVMPFVGIPLGGLWIAGAIVGLADFIMTVLVGHKVVWPKLFIVLWPVACVPVVWLAFVWPRSRFLVLHENGIRGKWPWRRFAVRFDDIEYVQKGRIRQIPERALDHFASVQRPDLPEVKAWLAANTYAIVLRSGARVKIGVLYQGFHADDVDELLNRVSTKIPIKQAGALSS